jgi:hypothetical protein
MSNEVRGKQARPDANKRLDVAAPRADHHRLVDDAPTGGESAMAAEGPRLVEAEQPAMTIAWRIERETVLAAALTAAERLPSVVQCELIGERDDDVAACHATQLVKRVMDGIGVLEHVQRDDHVCLCIRQRNAVAEICEHVGRRMDVQADVADGMLLQSQPERLIAAPGVEHHSAPDPRIGGHDALRLVEGARSAEGNGPEPLILASRQRHVGSPPGDSDGLASVAPVPDFPAALW